MENFQSMIAEILEEEHIEMSDELISFDTWDSLTILSIIAFCDDQYNVSLSADEINNSNTIQGLYDLIKTKI
jgi:acyl carrier protein